MPRVPTPAARVCPARTTRGLTHLVGFALASALLCADAAQIDIAGAAGSNAFGTSVTALPNGNVLVTDPLASGGIGAMHLYPPTGALISSSGGSTTGDRIGDGGLVALSTGNYVVASSSRDNSSTPLTGAVTWANGSTGRTGVVSAANSLIGGGAEGRTRAIENYSKLPLAFIENQGQTEASVAYYLNSSGYSLYFTPRGHALRLSQAEGTTFKAHTIKVDLVGANATRIESRQSAAGIVSYFKGPREQWKTAIPTHARIGYVQPWPGIDLSYNGHGGSVESIYVVAPHADPSRIKLRYSGQDSLKLDADGNLVYATSVGEVKETAPLLFQDIDGKRVAVKGSYRLLDKNTVGFKFARYDRDHALVIDPTLSYSGYIGGSFSDQGNAIAVDSSGNAYVTGWTNSTPATFPVTVGPDLTLNGINGDIDAFVAKLSADGSSLIYAGYVGGDANDYGEGIAVDAAGNAYLTGRTDSDEASFPVSGGPDLSYNSGTDAFVAKVNASGSALVYAGYIGGSQSDLGMAIAVDNSGNAYLSGLTVSNQASFPELVGPDLTYNGGFNDAFVAKVNAAGSALVYAGYIGGDDADGGEGIAVDSSGNAYVVGQTGSGAASFPVVGGPDLTFNEGTSDAFVAKVNPTGNALVYAGYVGGNGNDDGRAIAIDGAGNAYLSGVTFSTEATFPLIGGLDATANGSSDAYVAKVNPAGSALVYSGFIGGGNFDGSTGIAIDVSGSAYVAGYTDSPNFPVSSGPDLTFNGNFDGFVAKVNPAGTELGYSTYVGGNAQDYGTGIAADAAGSVYLVGYSYSTESTFPVTSGPDPTFNGGFDAFVAKIAEPSNLIFHNGFE